MADNPVKKNRYNDEELEFFRKLLEDKKNKAVAELDNIREQIVDLNENYAEKGGDLDENHVYTEVEFLTNMAVRQQKFVRALEAALIRVRNKNYGICSVTGELIDKQRLMVVPHATMSVNAKNNTPERVEVPRTSAASLREETDEEDGEEPKPKKAPAAKQPVIITKVIKRTPASGAAPAPAKKVVDDDDDDLYLGNDDDDDDDDDDDLFDKNVDMDDIADNGNDDDF